MNDRTPRFFNRLGYKGMRALLLGGGVVILVAIAAVMYVRRVDTAEVAAALLFVPVFVAALQGGLRWGLGAGLIAAVAYVAFRYPAIEKVGVDLFWGRIASRSVAYLLFGGFGGLFSSQFKSSLLKLEQYDQIDDETGLFNARFLVQDVDLELSRSKRYQTVFSVTEIEIPEEIFRGLSRRTRQGLIGDTARLIEEHVRTVDRAACAHGDGVHLFAMVLPETGGEGARIFLDRLVGRVEARLREKGATLAEPGLVKRALTFPGQDEEMEALKERYAEIDRRQHPEAMAAREDLPA